MENAITKALELCKLGYALYDSKYYAEIETLLSSVPSTPGIEKAIRLAQAGVTLSSPRFAYPHIESALRDPTPPAAAKEE